MATLAPGAETREISFWQKMALGIALFIVFGFAQFALRGFVDAGNAPIHVHLHGIAMLSWLALVVTQPWLVAHGNIAMHRRLGWLGLGLAAAVIALGSYTSLYAIETHRQPFFFTPAYFLALTHFGLAFFAGLLIGAIACRRRTDWHQRLMLGALIMIMEPALGRTLPMPLIMPWGEWLSMAVQLGVIGLIARHDLKRIGAVHPATWVVAGAIVASHAVVEALAITPAWAALANRIAGA